MIERFVGFDVALQTAKAFVIDYRRDGQLSYSLMRLAKPHKDELVKQVQTWLQVHYADSFTLDELAQRFNVSKRTLIRRFKDRKSTRLNSSHVRISYAVFCLKKKKKKKKQKHKNKIK